ncbi:MAG: 3-oxo-tetronate 4-phosphate decarboxylase, partial [bacterium]
MKYSKERELIASLGESIFNRGLTHGSSGNISVRVENGWLMTPTNSCLGRLDPAAISLLDDSGNLVSGDPPTKESFLHFEMYANRTESNAVVHLHSTHSVAVSCLEKIDPENVLPPITAYHVMKVGRLPLIRYYPPGDADLAKAVGAQAAKHHAILLANHGPVVAGRTLDDAVNIVEELEQTAKLYLLLRDKRYRSLSEDQVSALETMG